MGTREPRQTRQIRQTSVNILLSIKCSLTARHILAQVFGHNHIVCFLHSSIS
jgi:hypothetical protein